MAPSSAPFGSGEIDPEIAAEFQDLQRLQHLDQQQLEDHFTVLQKQLEDQKTEYDRLLAEVSAQHKEELRQTTADFKIPLN
mmetsp:Transcript_17489/g.34145  ORF Transcript_17489/g.34145 Transcript_17489/m.34145 type:complete len:81 (-) Transcript_17489:137-379(-)